MCFLLLLIVPLKWCVLTLVDKIEPIVSCCVSFSTSRDGIHTPESVVHTVLLGLRIVRWFVHYIHSPRLRFTRDDDISQRCHIWPDLSYFVPIWPFRRPNLTSQDDDKKNCELLVSLTDTDTCAIYVTTPSSYACVVSRIHHLPLPSSHSREERVGHESK